MQDQIEKLLVSLYETICAQIVAHDDSSQESSPCARIVDNNDFYGFNFVRNVKLDGFIIGAVKTTANVIQTINPRKENYHYERIAEFIRSLSVEFNTYNNQTERFKELALRLSEKEKIVFTEGQTVINTVLCYRHASESVPIGTVGKILVLNSFISVVRFKNYGDTLIREDDGPLQEQLNEIFEPYSEEYLSEKRTEKANELLNNQSPISQSSHWKILGDTYLKEFRNDHSIKRSIKITFVPNTTVVFTIDFG